ncbi:MAG: hypothetical protein AAFQ73_01025 [Pseudomonadota bacterium]
MIATSFSIYDGRAHVLGASMLASMYGALREAVGDDATQTFELRRAKFTRKTAANGFIGLALTETTLPDAAVLGASAAHAVGQIGGRTAHAWFSPDESMPKPPMRKSEHEVSEIVTEGAHGGACYLRASGTEQVLKGLVDSNKLVQLQGEAILAHFGHTKPTTELVFAEAWTLDVGTSRIDGIVNVVPLGLREDNERLYTLAKLTYTDWLGRDRSMRLGFSFAASDTS